MPSHARKFPALDKPVQKKRYSQVFLRDIAVVKDYLDLAELSDKDVLEIGAGNGIITQYLADHAQSVTSLEVDSQFVRILQHKFAGVKNVHIVHADALEHNLDATVIVGFLPYHLSSPLLFRILQSNFHDAILCLQKEFALRLVAKPDSDDYSRLTVMANAQSDVELWGVISRHDFEPVPRVDSALVHLVKNSKARLDDALVAALFQHKNQTVKNALWHSRRALYPDTAESELKPFLSSLSLAARKPRSLTLHELEGLSRHFRP